MRVVAKAAAVGLLPVAASDAQVSCTLVVTTISIIILFYYLSKSNDYILALNVQR